MKDIKINPDLQKEREQSTLDVEEFSEWWHGGKKNLAAKRSRGI